MAIQGAWMPFTSTQLQKLEEAISLGAKKVKYDDKEVEYSSLSEMLKVRDLMRRELGLVDSGNVQRVYPKFSKGLDSDCE
jgi:hypothetical protein